MSRIEFVDWGVSLGQRTILTGINLCLGEPGVVVLMGPAGTGKSTLLKTLAGQSSSQARHEGALLIDGQPLEQAAMLPVLVQQHPRDLALRAFDALAESMRAGNDRMSPAQLRERVQQALDAFGQHDLFPHLDSRLFDLPGDLMRRTLILRAALSNNPVVLIDEPTSGLGETQAATVLDLIRQLAKDRCCVVVLHHQAQAKAIADRVILLAGGRIQVDASNTAFFSNSANHPLLTQFLRTGSCHVPAPDARPEDLDADLSPGQPPALRPAADARHADATPARAPAIIGALPTKTLPDNRGPNGFHWLIPGKLAGCPMPGAVLPLEHDLNLLRNLGVTVLVNLTEKPMTQSAIPMYGMRSLHVVVEDRAAPPLMWMKLLLVKIDRLIHQGEVVAVHCLAGLGRTGTVLGAWLVREGLTADEALRRLRSIEPGFVQSSVQENLLHELETNLLIRAS